MFGQRTTHESRVRHCLPRLLPYLSCFAFFALLAAPALAQEAAVVSVAKDGSGDFATIQEAIDKAADHATIRIGPGEWEELVRITKPVTLEGAGWQKTRLIGDTKPEASREQIETLQRILFETKSDETRQEIMAAFHRAYGTLPTLSVSDTSSVVLRGIAILRPGSVQKGTLQRYAGD